MFKKSAPTVNRIWRWFRNLPVFLQLLFVIPILCAIAFTALIGNMGLALMGTAVALSAPIVGWVGGILAVILGKASLIIVKDKRKP